MEAVWGVVFAVWTIAIWVTFHKIFNVYYFDAVKGILKLGVSADIE